MHNDAITTEFAAALERVLSGQAPFTFHYQPLVDIVHGTAVGYEALARFSGPPSLPPDQWFAAAEALGRRNELEHLVCARSLESRHRLPPNSFLSVNVSPSFLLSRQWDELLESQGSLAGIVLEITENDPVGSYEEIQLRIAGIRAKGGAIAIDDVGSGYSSLKHVMEIRPNFIKLDRAFVTGCHLDPARAALIEMIGTIAGRLDAWIVAEGVETQPELEELARLEVPLVQGYHLGRPVPAMEPLSEQARLNVRATAVLRSSAPGIEKLVERCATAASSDQAFFQMESDPEQHFVLAVDQWRRPTALIERHPLLGVRSIDSVLRVQAESEIREVLHRALARPASLRFDPIAVVNGRGEAVGAVRMDRLIYEALRPALLPRGRGQSTSNNRLDDPEQGREAARRSPLRRGIKLEE